MALSSTSCVTVYDTAATGAGAQSLPLATLAANQVAVTIATPTTGQTVTVASGRNQRLIVNPAGTIAALTLNMAASPVDGDLVQITSTQIVTTLTMGGGTLVGALAAFVVGGFATFAYNASIGKWLRVG